MQWMGQRLLVRTFARHHPFTGVKRADVDVLASNIAAKTEGKKPYKRKTKGVDLNDRGKDANRHGQNKAAEGFVIASRIPTGKTLARILYEADPVLPKHPDGSWTCWLCKLRNLPESTACREWIAQGEHSGRTSTDNDDGVQTPATRIWNVQSRRTRTTGRTAALEQSSRRVIADDLSSS
jgi:hypothetical protein